MDKITALYSLISVAITASATLGAVYITNLFNKKRWEHERLESYKGELFRKKLEAYQELYRCCISSMDKAEAFNNEPTDEEAAPSITTLNETLINETIDKYRDIYSPLNECIENYGLVIPAHIVELAMVVVDHTLDYGELPVGSVKETRTKLSMFIDKCRKDIGIEGMSEDMGIMFDEMVENSIKKRVEKASKETGNNINKEI